jgi:hypothetical protein
MGRSHCSAVASVVGAMRRLSGTTNARNRKRAERRRSHAPERSAPDVEPDWTGKCSNCGSSPVLPVTGMCGPCTFGEAETAGGEW